LARGLSEPVLRVENLTVTVNGLKLVDDVSFAIGRGEMLGLVGESGCGKTITALAVMQLVPNPPVRIAAAASFSKIRIC
jgi:ABC-type dipeptide/oligopeptide/nickel transport system ATPase component